MTSSPAWDRLFPLLEHPEHAASIAVVTQGEPVTYGELVAQVSRIGDALADGGLRPGALIGLSASTKARWTSLYALCDRYGWVAVPMDPNAPAVELARLDAAIGLSAVIAWGTAGPVDWPDRRPLLATVAGDGAVHVAAGAGDGTEQQRLLDQAVIFPTSGSTGGSKQVVLSRMAIINGLDAVGGMWQLGPGVRVLEIAPLWLFAGYQYAMAAVRAGGTVVALEHLEPDGFLAATRDEVRGAFMVPTHARLLRDAWRTPPARTGLREILFGGERFEPELQHWLETTLPGTDITVEIGISEVGGQVSYLSDAQRREHPDAAGHVFTGASLQVLTDGDEIAATGTGRLLVRTDRMMTGYFQTLGVRWLDAEGRYQTEDTVRIDEDGLIHHLGRSSTMIRVGGRTINPAEIDAVAGSVPGVAEASTVGIGLDTGGQAAVLLVVADDAFDPIRLADALGERLSPFKRPTRVVTVAALPRNANKKVNIPAARLLATAADQLDLSTVDTAASFIAHGGDSISALRVAQRLDLAAAGDASRPAEHLLGARSLAELIGTDTAPLTRTVSAPAGAAGTSCPVAIEQRWPATAAQERLWYLEHAEGPAWSYNSPLWIRLDGPLDRARLETAFSTLVRDQPSLRCWFEEDDDGLWMREAGPAAWPGLGWSTAESEEGAFAVLADDCRRPFDIARPPLVRATAVRIGEQRHVLGLALHHNLTDYASGQVIVSRLRSFYDGLAPGDLPSPLHPAAIAAEERSFVDGPAGAAARAWWDAYLKSAVPGPPADGGPPAWRRVEVGADLRPTVRRTASALTVTEFSLLLYAFGLALRETLQRPEVVVGIIDARRPVVAAGHTVGCYFNTLPVRFAPTLSPDQDSLRSRFLPDLRTALLHARLPLRAVLAPWTRQHRTHFQFDAIFQLIQRAPAELADSGRLRLQAVEDSELPWQSLSFPRAPYEVSLNQPDLDGYLMGRGAGGEDVLGVWTGFRRMLETVAG